MKAPGWMELQAPYKGRLTDDGRSVVFTFRLNRWHPGYWLAVLRAITGRAIR